MSNPVLDTTTRQIVQSAFRLARITPAEQSLQPFELAEGVETLNFIIKSWQTQGLHLWALTEAVLPLNVGQQFYDLGPSGDECAESDSFFATNIQTDAVATDTVLEVFDASGLTGVIDILNFSPTTATTNWTAVASGIVTSDGTSLQVENGAVATSGGAEYTLETETGEEYLITFDYTQGTSASAIFSVISGSILDSVTLTSSGSGELRFTANIDEVTFSFVNGSGVISETSEMSNLNYQKISSGERVGIELNDGSRQWTYMISKDEVADPPTIRIADELTDDSDSGRIIYAYSESINRPLRVHSLRYADRSDRSEIPTEKWARQQYFDQPDKYSQGTVVQWYYDPQLTVGRMYVWQTASNVNNIARFTFERPLLISEETIDSVDIPAEWTNAIKWSLALDLAIQYGIKSNIDTIAQKAAQYVTDAEGFDVDFSSFQIVPNYSGA